MEKAIFSKHFLDTMTPSPNPPSFQPHPLAPRPSVIVGGMSNSFHIEETKITPLSPDTWKEKMKSLLAPVISHINACLHDTAYLSRFNCVKCDDSGKKITITIKIEQFKLSNYLDDFLHQEFINKGWNSVKFATVILTNEPAAKAIILITDM